MVEENVQQGGVGLPAGTKLGKYEIREKIAIGGQAIVYKGYDALLDRFVAIKQISSHLAEDPKFLERFRKEAQILARLGAEEPAIVTIHELLEDPRGLFIVMEYVEGRRLEAILEESPGPIESKAALQILWRLAGALYAVHANGIIHRDLKPSNIIVGEGLRAVITDFGVAASITGQTSMVLGTTKYMAPELFAGGDVDGRADMYSLGFIAYEMLAGRPKFKEIFSDIVRDHHAEALRWMKWHGNESVQAPPLHEVNPQIPLALSNIVARMMAKDLSQRFESMEALGRAIKMSFSPRARAAGGAPMVAAPAAPGKVGPGDEGDELDVQPEPSATAPLPKSSLSLRTKVILVGVILLTGIGFGVAWGIRSHLQNLERLNSAAGRYERIWKLYDKEFKYDEALKEIDALRKAFADSPESDRASVIAHLCRGHLLVAKASTKEDWDKAAATENDAKEELKRVQRARPELDNFVRDFYKRVDAFGEYRRNTWQFGLVMADARGLAEDGKLAEALQVFDRLRGLVLTDGQQQEIARFTRDVKYKMFKAEVVKPIDQGEDRYKQKDYPAAKIAFTTARDMLESKEADVLPENERRALKDQVTRRLNELEGYANLEQLLEAVKTAREKGDRKAELDALRALDSAKPADENKARMRVLTSELEFEIANQLATDGKRPEALAKLNEILAQDPGYPPATALKDKLEKAIQWEAMIQAGDAAFAARDFAQAMDLFAKAAKAQVTPELTAKINECDAQMMLTEANRLRDAKQYAEAWKLYEAIRAKHADKEALVQDLEQKMQVQVQYEDLLRQAEEAWKLRDFAKARDLLGRAAKVMPSRAQEITQRINEILYEENLFKGDEALRANRFDEALGYFKIAKSKKNTPEVNERIQETERRRRLEGSGGT